MVGQAILLKPGLEPYPGYQLRQFLGRGAFAEVWEAVVPGGRPLALKFLTAHDALSTAREIRSIQAVRQLRHPHLVGIDNVWSHLGYIVIAMELGDGSLFDLVDAYQTEFGTSIVPEHLCLLLSQAADALDFLNARQHWVAGKRVAIQHCDVKPSNMLLFQDRLKLVDFGLSSQTTACIQPHRRAGTLDYTAPEVFQGRLSDHTDQYALAVSYCQLRTSQLPFANTPSQFDRHYIRPEPDLSLLTESERPIIARALAHAPQDRWPSCRELMTQLAWVLH